MDDLQREFNRRTLLVLERLLGVEPTDRELVELRELLLTMELTDKLKPPPPASKPRPPSIDWWRLMPLLLTLALILAAVVASLLGVELGSLL